MPIPTLPAVDRPWLSHNREQSGKEGTPHNPLLSERLQKSRSSLEYEELFII